MLKHSKLILLAITIVIILSSTGSFAYGVDFNYDLQKVEPDYYYYEGLGQDKVVQSVKDGSWHILRPDGSLINLKGKYMCYVGTEGINLNFDDDYYHFLIGDEKNLLLFMRKSVINGYLPNSLLGGKNYF